MSKRYIVITPARDEAAFLERTIRSMVAQDHRPECWVIVNDGSTDRTGEIIDRWSTRISWIRPLHLESEQADSDANRGERALRAKEIEAFYRGYSTIQEQDWDYLVKLDADLEFAPDYFAGLLEEFDRDATLGIVGGVVLNQIEGRWEVEQQPRFHVRGATKSYRRECWEAIGGVRNGAGWDTLDEVHANMLGWKTCSLDHLRLKHLRPTGAANGAWPNAVKNGLWNYASGYHPLYMLAKCMKWAIGKGQIVSAAGLGYGFLQGVWKKVERTRNEPLIRYLRAQQLKKLTFRRSIWN